jgi:hypothetical protein
MLNNTNTAATLSTLATELTLPTSRDQWEAQECGFTRSMQARCAVKQDGVRCYGTIAYVADGGAWVGIRLDSEEQVHEWQAGQVITF